LAWSILQLPMLAQAWSCNDKGATVEMARVQLGEADSLAVCNDGSESAYYFSATSSIDWLVYLAGGGWCHDAASCAAREDGTAYPHQACATSSTSSPCFMSSKDFPASCAKTGIFDSQGPFRDANKVYVPYCTSDAYMGDGFFDRWHFRGARVVRAVLKDLQKRGLGPGSRLVFGGGSAGARGAMVLLDEVKAQLPGVVVHGFLDSPYFIDIPSLAANFSGFQRQCADVLFNFNASSVVPETCSALYQREDAWRCLFGQYRMPFLRTPYLLVAAQFDSWQLSHLIHGYSGIEDNPNLTHAEVQYAEKFGALTQKEAGRLQPFMPRGSFVYSAACYSHHISEKESFFTATTERGLSEFDAVRTIWAEEGSSIDTCTTYDCGSGCHSQVVLAI